MSEKFSCQTADFFVLRSPGLPMDELYPSGPQSLAPRPGTGPETAAASAREALRDRLRELARRPAVREALVLASPDLAGRIDPWLEGALDATAAGQVDRALLKYLGRMSSRATPFGLFAAVSTGRWGAADQLAIAPWRACRKSLRLDWGVLESLVSRLERAPEVRTGMTVRPNSSAYARGGWHRFLARRDQPTGAGRSYHLEAVEATPHLDFALELAREGATLEALAGELARLMAVEPALSRAFLEQVLDGQLLCGDLLPSLTSPDALGWLLAVLRSRPIALPQTGALAALCQALEVAQGTTPGSHPEGYPSLAAPLAELGIAAGTRDVLQVDLHRPAPELTLGPAVRRAFQEAAETLRRLTPPPQGGPLDRFCAAFQARYDTRWMPLLDVLDEESGIGFDGGAPLDTPLLDGLPFPSAAPPRPLTTRDQVLLTRLHRWQGQSVWNLDDADVEALENPEPAPFPPSFAALASLSAATPEDLAQGDFQLWMEHYSGPTAARYLGRFATGDPALNDGLQGHLRREEAARPEAVFAEVVHVPEGRMGNVLARPALRSHEIPFLATPGAAPDHVIPPADLKVTVRDGRVLLASARLGREVIPRLSSAHNFARGPVVYRFLAHLQDQDGRPGGWSWGALADQPFLPRVTRGRHVLCKARWQIQAGELKGALAGAHGDAWSAVQALRQTRGLPRYGVLTDADNALLVDLDQVLWAETLVHLVSGRPDFTITECYPAPADALVAAPEGRFAHELVIPFEAALPARPAVVPKAPLAQSRCFSPGSEWLYLKVYCGPASADRILVDLEPLLRLSQAKTLWDHWHFVRYRDPEPHLRLRFHGEPRRLLTELLPALHCFLDERQAQGLLWNWQIDTFEPEVERYGGAHGFSLTERWFSEDSLQVLQQLACGMPQDDRWRTGLADVDAIWTALGLSLAARNGLAHATREAFRREFGDGGEGAIKIGAKFRFLRRELELVIPLGLESPLAPGLAGLVRIREAADLGLLPVDRDQLAGSLAHMHLNRLLRRDHRETEWVLMEFLSRLYESQIARLRDAGEASPTLAAGAPRGAE